QWFEALSRASKASALRILLVLAERDKAAYNDANTDHPLRRFAYIVGWTDNYEKSPLGFDEQLAQCEQWLDSNEAKLKYDERTNRFTGALSPDRESLR